MSKINTVICGATGYSGIELLKILARHDEVDVAHITSESKTGKKVVDINPELSVYADYTYKSIKNEAIYDNVHLAFLCLPHEPAAIAAYNFIQKGIKVIDLSAAYRIEDLPTFEKYYKFEHPHPELLEQAVYGLPELYRDKIKTAELVANPGCYPTGALLPLMPLLANKIISTDEVIIDSKSGFTGRGKKVDTAGLYCEMNENFYAYGLGEHRHRPEIAQELSKAAQKPIKTTFSPHVLPLDRGILSSIYIHSDTNTKAKVLEFLANYYKNDDFVTVLSDKLPQIKWVANTNNCYIGAGYDDETQKLIIVSAIDNLIKGASGQAVQNMNIMFGFEESKGLI